MKELTCIRCPMGCVMNIEEKNGEYTVTGNTCPRGKEYAISEMTDPVRTFSVCLRLEGGGRGAAAVSVVSTGTIPYLLTLGKAARGMVLTAPVEQGQKIAKNVAGSGADLITLDKVRPQ